MTHLTTTAQVFATLGDVAGVSELLGVGYKRVWNWKAAGEFPPNTYVAISAALAEKQCTADPALWRMVLPEPTPADAAASSEAAE